MKYDKKQGTSFAIGMFATIELLRNKLDYVVGVYYSSKIKINDKVNEVFDFCKQNKIPLLERTKFIESIAGKENVFIIGEFKKYSSSIQNDNHLVLVNPSDMGNMGTIIRTCLGLDINNIAIIKPCVDIFDPKVIRASQGAIFKINIQLFESFEEYNKLFNKNKKYMFCLDGNLELQNLNTKEKPFSLIFGNESSGLPNEVTKQGLKIKIRQSNNIDSFNLAISVAMALYEFNRY